MASLACFKTYDIRGRVPYELDQVLARKIGFAMSHVLDPGPVVVGRDVRLSSPALALAVTEGLQSTGREVIDIGVGGTEEVYFQTSHLHAAGGVMVTASHNPMDYNGMKLVREDSRPISGDSGLFAMRDLVARCAEPVLVQAPVTTRMIDKTAFIRHLLGYVDRDRLKPLKIVVNAGNGGAGAIVDALAPHLPFQFIRIQHEADGHFPHGIPNPLLPERREATASAVRDHNADFGVAWDGDFDRCFFFDADGRFIEGYYLVGLLATSLLARHPGGRIVHDPRLVWNTIEMVRKAGGVPVMSKTGHAFIKERMRLENAVYGGEMSAHHYFRDFAYCDSGMIPWLLVAQLVCTRGQSLAELVESRMQAFPCSGEINFRVDDTQAATDRVMNHYRALAPTLDHTDGIGADFGNWRFNLRNSNTEPLLRLNLESRGDNALLCERTAEMKALIEG